MSGIAPARRLYRIARSDLPTLADFTAKPPLDVRSGPVHQKRHVAYGADSR